MAPKEDKVFWQLAILQGPLHSNSHADSYRDCTVTTVVGLSKDGLKQHHPKLVLLRIMKAAPPSDQLLHLFDSGPSPGPNMTDLYQDQHYLQQL